MASFDCSGVPRCTIDYSLEISPEEISTLAAPVNLLLKSNYLIGTNLETEATFDSLFDIAEQIAGVEACGFLLSPENGSGAWELRDSRRMDPVPPPEKNGPEFPGLRHLAFKVDSVDAKLAEMGECDEGADPLEAAKRQFHEETGFEVPGEPVPFRPVHQPS